MYAVGIFLIILNFSKCMSSERLNLGGSWWLNGTDEDYRMIEATVPGGIFSDLLSKGVIDDPVYGDNDQNYKWVGESNWTYFRNFTVGKSILQCDSINIVFEGIDTIASIFLNGINIGNSSNMFVNYIFNVKNIIKEGLNNIEVRFVSPVEFSKKLAEEQNKNYPIPPQCPPSDYRGECHINQLRKMQASFSWDWGPALASIGIWKDVYLESFSAYIIRYVVAEVIENNAEEVWHIKTKTFLSKNRGQKLDSLKIIYKISTDYQSSLTFVKYVNSSILCEDEPIIENVVKVPQNAVKRWWPNGYGEQILYDLNISIISNVNNDSFARRIGFRTVQLVQDEIKENISTGGNYFYFKVNGIPIFAKGSNYIPLSILPEKGQDKKKIDYLLQSARESHMNMLRVWGGGVYENDYFYQRADELGIMIWQDFMFACALYPTRPDFLDNVKTEIHHQLKRIGSHASIVVWAGNNENEAAITGNWYGSDGKQIYNDDYLKLYKETIQAEFYKIFEDGIFVLSSPSNGIKTEKDGGISRNPYDELYGDDHTYIYELDGFNPNIFPIPRFSSEFGYQSYPSYSTLKTITDNITDLVIGSALLKGRQHHPMGDIQMKLLIFYQLDLPAKTSPNYTKCFIYYSQVIQAVSIKTETEHYRKYRSTLTSDGRGFTMGALYWQLNDVWVAPTWSGIDVTGKWKMLQYTIRDVFAPIIVIGHLNINRSLDITVVSDKTTTIEDGTLSISIFKWTSFTPLLIINYNVTVELLSSKIIVSTETDNYLSQLGCGSLSTAANNCFFHLNFSSGKSQLAPENFVFPRPLKNLNLEHPIINVISVEPVTSNSMRSFIIQLESSNIALFIWLDSEAISGRFSENGFHLITPRKMIYFEADEDTDPGNLTESIKISNILSVR